MTCPKCRYHWCWICRGKYVSGHFSELNIFGCPGGMFEEYNWCKLIWMKLLFILVIPFLLFFGPIFYTLSKCFSCQNDYGEWTCVKNPFKFLFFILIGFPVCLAVGGMIGCLAIAFLLVPAWLLQLFRVFKIIFRKTDFCCLCRKLRRR